MLFAHTSNLTSLQKQQEQNTLFLIYSSSYKHMNLEAFNSVTIESLRHICLFFFLSFPGSVAISTRRIILFQSGTKRTNFAITLMAKLIVMPRHGHKIQHNSLVKHGSKDSLQSGNIVCATYQLRKH